MRCLLFIVVVFLASTGSDATAQVADLSIDIRTATTSVTVGDEFTIVVTLHNAGPNDAHDVRVDIKSKHLDLIDAERADGDLKLSRHNIHWDDLELAADESTSIVLRAAATKLPAVLTAEVKKASEKDPDSRPGKGTAEDDDATVTFSEAGASGGGDGGLESNGSLAQKIARVLYERRRSAGDRVDAAKRSVAQRIDGSGADAGGAIPAAKVFDRGKAIERARARREQTRMTTAVPTSGLEAASRKAASFDLRTPIPEVGPGGLAAREVSPEDLLPVTNAIDLVAVDYPYADGRRLGVVFAAATESGQVYEHTKVVCDRLRGASLEAIERLEIRGHKFVVSQLVQPDGTADYALSFVVYDHGDRLEIDSRFILGDYEAPTSAFATYNYQVWSETADDMVALADAMFTALEGIAPVEFVTDARPIVVPDVYVRTGYYEEGQLKLEVVNRAGATQLVLGNGTATRVEGGDRVSFTRELPIVAPGLDDPYETEVGVDLGPVFDAEFAVLADSSQSPDLLYLADGSWSWAVDSSGVVSEFEVAPADASRFGDSGTYAVERAGRLVGEMSHWATLFRYLRPTGAPVDLSAYTFLEFTASGEGTMRVQLEKASMFGSAQFGQTLQLTDTPTTYRVWFDQVATSTGATGFTPEDVVMLSFNAENRDHAGEPEVVGVPGDPVTFAMQISDIRFRGGESDIAQGRPENILLYELYPNPVTGVAHIRFDLPEPGRARLGLFDATGRRVALLTDGFHAAGPHVTTYDTSGLGAGVYFTWLETEIGTVTRGLIVR